MPRELRVSVGQWSSAGRKAVNQDSHGSLVPEEPLLGSKGVTVAIADGIGSSEVSQVASQSAIRGFLSDYYCTSDAWSVKTSAQRVLLALNSWLHSQTRRSPFRYERDKGYVCTFSALVVKSSTAHLFHVGDSRIWRVSGGSLEQLTRDHRVVVSSEESYLARALGADAQLSIEFQALSVEEGDVFVLTTDGVHEHVDGRSIAEAIAACPEDLDLAARRIVEQAFEAGSPDNLTTMIARVDSLPEPAASEILRQISDLPLPPVLEARDLFDGYRIHRRLHASHRSHIHLATDLDSGRCVVLKTPSVDLLESPGYLERFQMEEWVARRIDSPHVLKPCATHRKRNYLYVVTEFIEGRTLAQWMVDNPVPSLDTVRGIVEQIAKGLQAFHSLEMLHQDLRPENIMIDTSGTVKIIDFGSTRVAGLAESDKLFAPDQILGTYQYTAPEYFLGEGGSNRSDVFSLGVIAYQMLRGRLPYGARVAQCRTRAALGKLVYETVLDDRREIPLWIDGVLKKAVHPDPARRYAELSEFVYDLHHPPRTFPGGARPPLLESHPLLFWKGLSLLLATLLLLELVTRRAP
ncbi:MAG: bifunctional protein-serine/threonine kinase/phosphatase [Fibrobacteria bacterium]|nr:bifunctional protein-serine/threonine kinase/phosphatase [Fibrobacteria bacterium]